MSKLDYPKRHAGLFRKVDPLARLIRRNIAEGFTESMDAKMLGIKAKKPKSAPRKKKAKPGKP